MVAFHVVSFRKIPARFDAIWQATPFGASSTGPRAVHLFFVLSGCVLALSLARDSGPGGVARYYVRRIFRIQPPYMAAVLLAWLASQWWFPPLGHGGAPRELGVPWVRVPAASCRWRWCFRAWRSALPVGWSLFVETGDVDASSRCCSSSRGALTCSAVVVIGARAALADRPALSRSWSSRSTSRSASRSVASASGSRAGSRGCRAGSRSYGWRSASSCCSSPRCSAGRRRAGISSARAPRRRRCWRWRSAPRCWWRARCTCRGAARARRRRSPASTAASRTASTSCTLTVLLVPICALRLGDDGFAAWLALPRLRGGAGDLDGAGRARLALRRGALDRRGPRADPRRRRRSRAGCALEDRAHRRRDLRRDARARAARRARERVAAAGRDRVSRHRALVGFRRGLRRPGALLVFPAGRRAAGAGAADARAGRAACCSRCRSRSAAASAPC